LGIFFLLRSKSPSIYYNKWVQIKPFFCILKPISCKLQPNSHLLLQVFALQAL
ncbi:unnamed protein product, partial [Brassica oleracea var. botrytis]